MSDDVKCRIRLKKRILENTLRGKVQIVSKMSLVIQKADIEIVGLANCSFELGRIYAKFPKFYSENTVVKGSKQFYRTKHSLCGGELYHQHKGQEVYRFSCFWPSRLPPTWSGELGNIEYAARVEIELENKDVYTHFQLVTVNPRRDLSTERHLLFEGRIDVRRNFFTTKNIGNVTVTVWIPICGIAAGQSLPVLCSIYNRSKLHFGSLLFVLTRIEIYRSDTPIVAIRKVRYDVCRAARMVNIHKGKYEYYAVLQTDQKMVPTNQFYECQCCQVIYEVWVSVQGAFKRYRTFGYPNIDTPGIPLIIGTKPLRTFNPHEISTEVLKKMFEYNVPILVDELPDDFKQIFHKTEEDLSREAVENLERQLQVNEQMISTNIKENSSQKLGL